MPDKPTPKNVAPASTSKASRGARIRHPKAEKRHSLPPRSAPRDPVNDVLRDALTVPASVVAEIEAAEPLPLSEAGKKRDPAEHRDGVPLGRIEPSTRAALVPAPELPPWRPGQPRQPQRRARTFEEDAREILSAGVPTKLRGLVALKTGLPIDLCAGMSLRQAIILLLLNDAMERGHLDKLDRVLDRTDPKARRMEHTGAVGHLHVLAGKLVNMTEAEATETYRQLVQGGGSVIDVESEGSSEAD